MIRMIANLKSGIGSKERQATWHDIRDDYNSDVLLPGLAGFGFPLQLFQPLLPHSDLRKLLLKALLLLLQGETLLPVERSERVVAAPEELFRDREEVRVLSPLHRRSGRYARHAHGECTCGTSTVTAGVRPSAA